MDTNKNNKHLDMICSHPGVTATKLSDHKYLITFKRHSWYLWPRSGRYRWLNANGAESEDYYGELKLFYHRYIAGTIDLPANFGKVWSRTDEETLFDMIEHFCTVAQIAKELERHPNSIVTKLAAFYDDSQLFTEHEEEFFDVPVRELLGSDLP